MGKYNCFEHPVLQIRPLSQRIICAPLIWWCRVFIECFFIKMLLFFWTIFISVAVSSGSEYKHWHWGKCPMLNYFLLQYLYLIVHKLTGQEPRIYVQISKKTQYLMNTLYIICRQVRQKKNKTDGKLCNKKLPTSFLWLFLLGLLLLSTALRSIMLLCLSGGRPDGVLLKKMIMSKFF